MMHNAYFVSAEVRSRVQQFRRQAELERQLRSPRQPAAPARPRFPRLWRGRFARP